MRVRPPCIARHTVWRKPLLHPRPRLHIAKIRAPIADDPLRGDVLDELEYAFILPDGANSGALRTMEMRVLDEHVRRIGFGRDRVVAPGHVPAAQGDVVRVKGVDAVRVLCGRLCTNIMYALSGISSRVGTRRRTLLLETEWMKMSSKRRSRAVCTASDQNWLWTKRMPRIVKLVEWRMTRLMGRPAMLLVPLARSYLMISVSARLGGRGGQGTGECTTCIPYLPVPVERAVPMPGPEDVVASKVPGDALVLIFEGSAVLDPIRGVRSPLHGAGRRGELGDMILARGGGRHVPRAFRVYRLRRSSDRGSP